MAELRAARPDEARCLARLAHEGGLGSWDEGALRAALRSRGGVALVAAERGEPVALLLGRQLGGEAELLLLVVEPSQRRRGLGRLLLEHYLKELRASRARRVTLEVRRSNQAARALYREAGFGEWGERPRYYADGEPALLLGTEL